MRQTYVLDTSSLIYNPSLYKEYPHSDFIIPISVLNELDSLKKQSSEAGRNARVCIRLLDELSDKMDITTGIMLDNDILLKVDTTYNNMSDPDYAGFGDPTYGDTQILACLYSNWQSHIDHNVTLISNDINLRVKAKARGIDAIYHEEKNTSLNDLYVGNRVIINEEAGLDLQRHGYIDTNVYGYTDLNPNECILFQDENGDGIAMGRLTANNKIKLLKKVYPWGLSPRNKEQNFAIDLIMDRNIDLVTLVGLAGCGKTIVTLASALELVISRREYDRLVIYRPIQSVGPGIGYTPGTIQEKLRPWFQAIMDGFEALFGNKGKSDWRKELEMFQNKGRIEMEAITYIRGRSIPNSIIYVDECQNISKEDIKTILTRAGENTKLILSGDINQIDSQNLDINNNGLTYVIEKFKNSDLAGHITFTKGERSRLATKASEIL